MKPETIRSMGLYGTLFLAATFAAGHGPRSALWYLLGYAWCAAIRNAADTAKALGKVSDGE